jgi:predicted molibdopterin-dependent oxidoreductase YjgC
MAELARAAASYGGIRRERLGGEGLAWPCPTPDHPGTPILHTAAFTRERGKFHVVPARWLPEQPDAEYPLVLTTGRVLYQYHPLEGGARQPADAGRRPRPAGQDPRIQGLRRTPGEPAERRLNGGSHDG